jgi:hypothetical protein
VLDPGGSPPMRRGRARPVMLRGGEHCGAGVDLAVVGPGISQHSTPSGPTKDAPMLTSQDRTWTPMR